jgi:hypothetical protein
MTHRHGVFTEKEFAEVEDYVRQLQTLCGLGNWKLHIQNEPTNTDAYAETNISDVGMDCYIKFSEDFYGLEKDQIRETVLHEMMHMWLQHLVSDYELNLAPEAKTLLRREAERVVDGMACAMAGLLPLPGWK